MGALAALGLPLVLGIPQGISDKLYALTGLLAISGGAAMAIVAWLHRPNRPFGDSAALAPARAAEPAALAAQPFDPGGWSLELLRRLEWRRFEELCAAYFELQGFGGVVRCKAWSTQTVGVQRVRELRAAVAAGDGAEGVLVISGKFTREARDFAAKEKLSLIDGGELIARIAALVPEQAAALLERATQGDYLTPTCPACEVKMVSCTSTEGGRKFWGCPNYPRCKENFFSTHNAPA